MLKGRDQIGKRVVTVGTGEEIDKVRDIVFDQAANEVLGFLLDEGGLFSAARVVPFSCVRAVGPDAILVSDTAEWKTADTALAVARVLKGDKVLKGTTLMTTDGRDLGQMMDLYFDDTTGRLTGYEVSGGIFADAYSGRSFVPAPKSLTLGADVALVPAETADLMEEQPGGVKAAVQRVAGRAGNAVGATATKVKEVSLASAERVEHAMGATAAKVKEVSLASAERVEHAAEATAAKIKEVSIASAGRVESAMGATAAKVKEVSLASAERVQHAAGEAAAKVKDASLASAERAQALGQKMSETATNAVVTPDDQRAFALGKTTREAVLGPDGQTLVAEGVVVTAEIADDAQRRAALGRLYRATGGSVAASGWESTKTMAKQAAAATSSGIASVTARQAVEAAKGRRVQQDVRTDQGSIIAAPGMIVSDDILQQVREANLEEELLEAVGLSRGGAARAAAADVGSRTRSAAADVAETLKAGAARATAGVGQLWNRVTETIEDVKERAVDAREDRRIQGALGRPVTRVILDRDDAVILNVGEVVTNAAVDRSRDADMLDALLDATSRENPPLTAEEFRAPEHGDAAIESGAASEKHEPDPPSGRADQPREVATNRSGKKR